MYIENLKHFNCEIHLTKSIILVTTIEVKSKFSNSTDLMIFETDPRKKGHSN